MFPKIPMRMTLPRMILVSGVLHILFILATVFLTFPGRAMSIYKPQYQVRLIGRAEIPSLNPKQSEESSKPAQPAEPVKQEKKQVVVPEKKEEEKAAPVPKVQEKVKPTPPKPSQSSAQKTVKEPKREDSMEEAFKRIQQDIKQRNLLASKGGSSSSGGGLTAGEASLEYNEYYEQISNKIWENWIQPESYDPRVEHYKTIVRLRILPDGKIDQNWIERSSGNRYFDESVMRAILQSNPLPPPPQSFGTSGFEIGLIFDSSQHDKTTTP